MRVGRVLKRSDLLKAVNSVRRSAVKTRAPFFFVKLADPDFAQEDRAILEYEIKQVSHVCTTY